MQYDTVKMHQPTDATAPASADDRWTPRTVDPATPIYQPRMMTVPVDANWLTEGGAARISGSDHGRWIVERTCADFREFHPPATFDIDLRGTPSAMAFLMSGKSMLSVMGREITPVEASAYEKCIGAPPVGIRVAHTAEETSQHLATSLAVYVHRSNPLQRITTQQLSKIFTIGNAGGDFSRWGQLGLAGEWEKRMIHPIGTPEFTGFGTYMQEHHLGGRPLNPLYERYIGTGDVLGRLEADPSGVAVAALGCETEIIRLLPIAQNDDGYYSTGSTQDVRNDRYAFGRFLYFYLPQRPGEKLCSMLTEYLRFVLSAQGQAIVAAQPLGYIPLRPDEIAEELQKLDQIPPAQAN